MQYPSALVCWPAEFTGWRLLASTNAGSTNWVVVPGVTNRLLETPMTPQKYFRIQNP